VIAVESDVDLPGAVPFNDDMVVERSGRWKIFYRPKAFVSLRIAGLLPVEEIEAYLHAAALDASQSPQG